MKSVVGQPEPDHLVHDAVVERDVGAGLDLAEDVGVVGHLVGSGVDVDDRGSVAAGLLEERRRDRVVGGGVAAGDDRHVRVHHVAVGGGHGAGADALEQGGHAGGVAEPGAVVHVVGVEPGPDQLLEEVGLLVGALGRPEAGDRGRAVLAVDLGQPPGDQVQRLLPGGLPEVRQHLGVVDQAARPAPAPPLALLATLPAVASLPAVPGAVLVLGPVHLTAHVRGQRSPGVCLVPPDERRGEPLWRGGVVPAVAPLDAQAALRAGLVAAFSKSDRAPLPVHVVGEGAADAAVGTHAVHRVQFAARPDGDVPDRLVGQRTGRARGDTLAAGDARRVAHRVVEVEGDPGGVALAAAADDVVALDVVAGADAAVAQDAGVVIDRDDGVGKVRPAARGRGQAARAGQPEPVGEGKQFVVAGGGLLGVALPLRLVGQQQLGQRRAVALDVRGGGLDLHAVFAGAHAGGGVGPCPDVHHAHPADADRVVALVVAQHRDVDPRVLGRGPDGRALRDGDLDPVDRQADGPRLGGSVNDHN